MALWGATLLREAGVWSKEGEGDVSEQQASVGGAVKAMAEEEVHPTNTVDQSIAELFIRAELLSPQPPAAASGLLEQVLPTASATAATLSADDAPLQNKSDDDCGDACLDNTSAPSAASSKPEPHQPPMKRQKRARAKKKVTCCEQYVVKFKGNDSKVWDGKPITIDADWLEERYDRAELFPGRVVELDWPDAKKKTSVNWRCVIVSMPEREEEADDDSSLQAPHETPAIATMVLSEEEALEQAGMLQLFLSNL